MAVKKASTPEKQKKQTSPKDGVHPLKNQFPDFENCVASVRSALHVDEYFDYSEILELVPHAHWRAPFTYLAHMDSIRFEILAAYAQSLLAKFEKEADVELRALGKYHANKLLQEVHRGWSAICEPGREFNDRDEERVDEAWERVWSAFKAVHSGEWYEHWECFEKDYENWKHASFAAAV